MKKPEVGDFVEIIQEYEYGKEYDDDWQFLGTFGKLLDIDNVDTYSPYLVEIYGTLDPHGVRRRLSVDWVHKVKYVGKDRECVIKARIAMQGVLWPVK